MTGFFSVFYIFFTSCVAVVSSNNVQVFQETVLNTEEIKSFTSMSFRLCIEECVKLKGCASVNYVRLHLRCKLLPLSHFDKSTSIDSDTTYIYIEKESNTSCGLCQHEYETCILLSSGANTCIKTECSNSIPVVSLSSHSRSYDPPTVKFTCDPGTVSVGISPFSTCIPGQPWTSIDMSCFVPECASGWIRVNNKCFKVETTNTDVYGAIEKCKTLDSTVTRPKQLAEISNSQEKDVVASLNSGLTWISGTDAVTEGTWIHQASLSAITYSNWELGEPNGGKGENCVIMSDTGKYIDAPCSHTYPQSVCEYTI